MILKQNPNAPTVFLGLYGTKVECDTFDLTQVSIIQSVFQIREGGVGIESYVGGYGSFLSTFTSLECGKIYLIVLKPGNSQIDIPNLSVSTFEGDGLDISTASKNLEERVKKGDYYYSKHGMYKYKVMYGTEYETNEQMYDIHKAFDLWEVIAKHKDPNFVHEIGVYFLNFEESYGDEYSDVLAMAAPVTFDKQKADWEFGNTFPIYSEILINTSYISYMKTTFQNNGTDLYFNTILHEIAHAIGLHYYALNEFKNTPIQSYVDANDGKTKFYYYGKNALYQYKQYFREYGGLIGVPMEDEVEAPRVAAHWEEGFGGDRYINGVYHPALVTAMMTPFADEHSTPLTKIIIGYLEDYGYDVDYSLANPFEN